MTDHEIIQKLIARDNRITQKFFFEDYKPLFLSIIYKVFDYEVDYNEFVNEWYLYLMDKDAQRLRDLRLGTEYSLKSWLIVTATRFFIKKRNRLIENKSQEPLNTIINIDNTISETTVEASIDIERVLSEMPNERYTYVIRKLVLEDMAPEDLASEMGINTSNLYNIKKRAMLQLTQVVIKDIKYYKKQ